MKNDGPNFTLGRRNFLKAVLPAGPLSCLACGHLSAASRRQDPQKPVAEEKHKFLEDSGLTMKEVFRFAFLWIYIPMMQELAAQVGREKFLDMIKKGNDAYLAKWIKRLAQNIPEKSLAAFFALDMLESVSENAQHKERFWSLATTSQTLGSTPTSYEMKVTECLWAQTFREANAADIGFVTICYPDVAIAAAFDPRLKLYRTKTLMNGDDCCDFRWVWEG